MSSTSKGMLGKPAHPLITAPLQSDDPFTSLDAGRAMARSLAVATENDDRLGLAQAFCHRMVSAWWEALTNNDDHRFGLRALLQPLDMPALPNSAAALAESMGTTVAHLNPENAAYQVGLTYTGMLPSRYRSRFGIYYTPPDLTARLIDQATLSGVDWTRCRVLDPACGGGAFLAPVAQRILDALPNCSPRILIKNIATRLHGYEIDSFAAWLSQITLDVVLLPVCRIAGHRLSVVVTICDSLKHHPPEKHFDLVIGNPPYGRVRLEPNERIRYRRSLYGHANLYGLFTDMALRHVKRGGVIAYVTPTSFLAGRYFKSLRALLGREAPPVAVDFVAQRKGVFEDVLQETVLTTYRCGDERVPVTVRLAVPNNAGGLRIETVGTFTLPNDSSQPWLSPRTSDQAPLVARLATMPHRLTDWGYAVSTGPLVWNRHKDQLAKKPGNGRLPLIWAEAVTADGQFVWRAAKKNHTLYFEPKHGDEWLISRSPCVLLQRTTAKEQRHRLIATMLPELFLKKHGAVVVENHLNMLRPTVDRPQVAPAVLTAFLNSTAADQAFRCINGSVAVSAYELESLPLPAPEALTELSELVAKRSSRADVEAACAELYASRSES
ncbi:MAG: N-6 DNA methylase [Kiloniellales bacterium]